MFPVRYPTRYISLHCTDTDDKEFEIGLIEDLGSFPKDQQDLVWRTLQAHYYERVISRIRNEKRGGRDRTPASAALWRAYAALSAARYHLQHSPEEEGRVRELRNDVEEIWRELSPMFEEEEEAEAEAEG